jgi:hypothetical protein
LGFCLSLFRFIHTQATISGIDIAVDAPRGSDGNIKDNGLAKIRIPVSHCDNAGDRLFVAYYAPFKNAGQVGVAVCVGGYKIC